MATVEVTFTALPAHVRTARLVATAVARRSGVAESLMDEVRLAVGEACSRAVETHAVQCPDKPVRLALSNQAGRFQIEVINAEFTPSKSDAEEAIALIAAFEEHARRGAGAFAWKGQMMDMPHLTRARKIADRARQAGVL